MKNPMSPVADKIDTQLHAASFGFETVGTLNLPIRTVEGLVLGLVLKGATTGETRMHAQDPDEFRIHRIVSLLVRTDMSIKEIAERMGCSPDVVDAINREYEARDRVSGRYKKKLRLSMSHEKGKPEARLDL